MSEQTIQLSRVAAALSPAIIKFCETRDTFHASELHEAVEAAAGKSAPASADRVLRLLRQAKKLNYRVVNRRQSLYQVMPA